MANPEQLAILRQGVEVWNRWREEYLEIQPDLSEATLNGAILNGANLNGADLTQTIFTGAELVKANFVRANLNLAYLGDAWLLGANLTSTQLTETNLKNAWLSEATLSEANLYHADLSGSHLRGVDFSGAAIVGTIFGDVDLSEVKGLEKVKHMGKSYIDIHTIYRSGGNISEAFLRGIGTPETMIEYMRSLVGKPIDYYSCFISYSSKDQDFAERLYADLQSKGVRCWFALEDLKIGDKIRPRIDESIRLHDKLLLVLSQNSTASQWVEQEVTTALARERKEQRTVLFPIRLDNAIMEIESDWPFFIRNTRHIGDFTSWKNHDQYQKAFTRLLYDLKAEDEKTEER